MATPETNGKEVVTQRLVAAREILHDLQEWLILVDDALERAIEENNGKALSIFWASEAIQKSLCVYNEIARCNGASLVTAVSPPKRKRAVRL